MSDDPFGLQKKPLLLFRRAFMEISKYVLEQTFQVNGRDLRLEVFEYFN
jgi:hypothetical protein